MEEECLVQYLKLNKIYCYCFQGIVVECNIGLDVIEHGCHPNCDYRCFFIEIDARKRYY
jgi:hypothetical protein